MSRKDQRYRANRNKLRPTTEHNVYGRSFRGRTKDGGKGRTRVALFISCEVQSNLRTFWCWLQGWAFGLGRGILRVVCLMAERFFLLGLAGNKP
jgi:hypothetical protein